MNALPAPRSTSWISIFAATFILNFVALIASRAILEIDTPLRTNIAFLLISGVISLTSALGYLGLTPWYAISAVGNIGGLLYLLFLSLTNHSDGWTDLTSIISYLTLTIGAFLLGALVQFAVYIYKVFRHS
jgi:hypothetical protein